MPGRDRRWMRRRRRVRRRWLCRLVQSTWVAEPRSQWGKRTAVFEVRAARSAVRLRRPARRKQKRERTEGLSPAGRPRVAMTSRQILPFAPPAIETWLLCSQLRKSASERKEGARPGETSSVVYFCVSAPSAHWGKVMSSER
eukprot:1098924-Pleurochrysis_carterae.AAC.1